MVGPHFFAFFFGAGAAAAFFDILEGSVGRWPKAEDSFGPSAACMVGTLPRKTSSHAKHRQASSMDACWCARWGPSGLAFGTDVWREISHGGTSLLRLLLRRGRGGG